MMAEDKRYIEAKREIHLRYERRMKECSKKKLRFVRRGIGTFNQVVNDQFRGNATSLWGRLPMNDIKAIEGLGSRNRFPPLVQ
jgi:hypothetical protein